MNAPGHVRKRCVNCGRWLPDNKRKDAIYCSEKCGNRMRSKRWEALNPDKKRNNRIKDNKDTKRFMFTRVKSRCKINGIKFDIEKDDIIIPKYCPILGLELKRNVGEGRGFNPCSPSLDRIDPELGYVKGNVRVISWRANLLKSNAEVWELEAVLKDLKRLRHE